MQHVLGPSAPHTQVRAHARRVCINLIKGYYDLFNVDQLSADDIKRRVKIDGWDYLEQALAAGRGVIITAAHFGNVDLVMQIPALHGLPVTVVAQRIRPERVYRYLVGLRGSHGLHIIPSDGPMLSLFRALKRGEAIGLACDRAVTENARETLFFGSPARLPPGPVEIACRTGAILVPARAVRLPDDSFHVRIEPPIEIESTEDLQTGAAAGMQRLVAVMERWIAEHPDQWLLSVPIWRQAPCR